MASITQPSGIGRSITGTIDRLIRWSDGLADPPAEIEEPQLEPLLHGHRQVSRPNLVAVMSPKGGVGKTTCAFLLGNLLASHLNQRVVVVDATPELGMLSGLAAEKLRSDRCMIELLEGAEEIENAAGLHPYMSCLPSGAHLLAAPRNAAVARRLSPPMYEGLVRLLSVFYDVVLLDMGTGLASPLAQFAVQRADQLLVVTTPDAHTASAVLASIGDLPAERTTVVFNMAQPGTAWDQQSIEQHLDDQRVLHSVTLPFDEQLLQDLNDGTYDVNALERQTRMAAMRLGASVFDRLA